MIEEEIYIKLPTSLFREIVKGKESFSICHNDKTDKLIGNIPIISQGDTLEEAEKEAWNCIKYMYKYHDERSKELDLWKPLQIGPWKDTAGKWFTIYGIHVYFRYGKNMLGGFYIPFTKLNIIINNLWRRK
jgi:hypothetical protein